MDTVQKYKTKYFKDDKLHDKFINSGYVITKFNSNDVIDLVSTKFYEIVAPKFNAQFPDRFINTGTERIEGLRELQRQVISEYLIPEVKPFFDLNLCEVNAGVFLIKPPTPDGVLKIHQDGSIIDETKYYGLYAWIPLCDTTIENGTMHIVPGSHLLNNHHRAINVPWAFEDVAHLFKPFLKPICLKKGEILFYDNALVHYSPMNKTSEIRVAASISALPKSFSLINYFVDEKTPKNQIEAYEVDEDFWIKKNIFDRPENKYKHIGYFQKYKLPFFQYSIKKKIQKYYEYAESFTSVR